MKLADYHREGWLGAEVRYVPRVGSTNDLALDLGRQGAPGGLLVVAEAQSAGRGRLSRRWHDVAGTCLLLSLLFRPPAPFAHYAGRATIICGLALLDAVQAVTSVPVALKWPNDLIITYPDGRWRKVAGMLSEVGGLSSQAAFLVVGIGLNVNVPAVHLPALDPNATSLAVEAGRTFDRAALLDAFLSRAEARYDWMCQGGDPLPQWRERLVWLGRAVRVQTPTQLVQGVAETVDDTGALVLRLPDGTKRHVSVGDVHLRPS